MTHFEVDIKSVNLNNAAGHLSIVKFHRNATVIIVKTLICLEHKHRMLALLFFQLSIRTLMLGRAPRDDLH